MNSHKPTLSAENIAAIAGGYHGSPFDMLGMHPVGGDDGPALAIRTFQPQARDAAVLREGSEPIPMAPIYDYGFFEAVLPGEQEFFTYQLKLTTHEGATYTAEDPYRFPPVLTEFDLHLIGEGTHTRLYEKLGAHLAEVAGVAGVVFAVWAPSAERVSVVGSFNQWDGRRHPMRPRGSSGIWELFIPGLAQGDIYKYEIKTRYKGYIG